MKTFKLKELQIVDYESEGYDYLSIPLIDGLIINREDDENQWLVEAYIDKEYFETLENMKNNYEEIIIHVRITTEANELATCLTQIIGLNEIGEHMNVLFLGTMVEQRTNEVEEDLKRWMEEGNKGTSLLNKFKENN
jgi:hypothetical protein